MEVFSFATMFLITNVFFLIREITIVATHKSTPEDSTLDVRKIERTKWPLHI
jgi:hypothetical protein